MKSVPDRMYFDLREFGLGELWFHVELGNPRDCPTCGQTTLRPVYLIPDHPSEQSFTNGPMATHCPNCPPEGADQ